MQPVRVQPYRQRIGIVPEMRHAAIVVAVWGAATFWEKSRDTYGKELNSRPAIDSSEDHEQQEKRATMVFAHLPTRRQILARSCNRNRAAIHGRGALQPQGMQSYLSTRMLTIYVLILTGQLLRQEQCT